MADGINLTIYKNGESTGLDITQLVESIKWAGRRGSPCRGKHASADNSDIDRFSDCRCHQADR